MSQQRGFVNQTTGSRTDDVLSVLADEERRRIVATVVEAAPAPVPVERLAGTLAEDTPADPEDVRLHVHHAHVPKLVDSGLVDYEAEAGHLRYDGGGYCEELLEIA